jgi:hypothetical protein
MVPAGFTLGKTTGESFFVFSLDITSIVSNSVEFVERPAQLGLCSRIQL